MKKALLSIALSAFVFSLIAGTGLSADSPLTVSQALAKKNDRKSYYINGYIVGEYRDYSNNKHFYNIALPFDGTSAYLIADEIDEIDLSKMMPVQIKDYVDSYNLDENPQYWRKQLTIKGTLTDYFTLPGIKNLTDWIAPGENVTDETKYWNFYETFETKKAYTPNSTLMYGGGIYASAETCRWKFVGATYGDSSNDMKWDNAAAHLRLTESTSGEPGYIYMLEDKSNGIGYIRLWAARYKDDKGSGSFGVYISNDKGKTWEPIQTSIPIKKELTEYQFKVMRPGELRIKIGKTENSTTGIDIDNIHISDYYTTSSVENMLSPTNIRIWSSKGHLCFDTKMPEQIDIYLINGTLVKTEHIIGSGNIALPAGFYIVSIKNTVTKIIVQ